MRPGQTCKKKPKKQIEIDGAIANLNRYNASYKFNTGMNNCFCGLTYYICVSQKRYINDSDNGNSSDAIVFLLFFWYNMQF